MTFNTKYEPVEIYAETIEQEAISQILRMANSPLGENAHIRIMPDCHAGAGCTIGTTMLVQDKVCPNLVGVDIGCGVTLVRTTINFSANYAKLDAIIREHIPYGMNGTKDVHDWNFADMHCWSYLTKEAQDRAYHSLGTLGGGNHFIEAYNDGWLAVHSGSRNIGYKVAEYYQDLAYKRMKDDRENLRRIALQDVEPKLREQWLKDNIVKLDRDLAYLTGQDRQDYLDDLHIMQMFAADNRNSIVNMIVEKMGGRILEKIESVHNYIDFNHSTPILRKGAISANYGERLVIPLNMRDGILICRGKGNAEWNYSAPHGAGRLYSRGEAKRRFTVEEYSKSMEGIYTTCVNEYTLDEAPFVYKDWFEIAYCIEPTVEIIDRLLPIYNFKAN